MLAYLKKVVEKLKEKGADEAKIKAFQTGATNYYTKVIKPNFKDFDFYTGESMDPDGMYVWLPTSLLLFNFLNRIECLIWLTNVGDRVILLNYREDGMTPYVTIWKYGLKEEKVWFWVENVGIEEGNRKGGRQLDWL